nr:DegT/DnrJ/EryC1/StrS family aminotransferase [Bacteroidota bacterium]
MKRLRRFANKHSLYLIEDSCDTLGGQINKEPTGKLSDISICSFYASHHITTAGSGGMLCTDNDKFLARAIAYRDWGRFGDDNEDVGERFNLEVDGIPYDRKFVYSVVGYNFKPTEVQAAFGLAQLAKLPAFNRQRRRNSKRFNQYLKKYKDFFIFPEELPKATVTWLAFPLTLKDNVPFTRLELINYLEANNIQVRLLFSGNIFRQPAFKNAPRRVVGELTNADKIMKDSFVIGCHPGLTDEMIDYVCGVFDEFMKPHMSGSSKSTLV